MCWEIHTAPSKMCTISCLSTLSLPLVGLESFGRKQLAPCAFTVKPKCIWLKDRSDLIITRGDALQIFYLLVLSGPTSSQQLIIGAHRSWTFHANYVTQNHPSSAVPVSVCVLSQHGNIDPPRLLFVRDVHAEESARKTSAGQQNGMNCICVIKSIQLLLKWEHLLGGSILFIHFQGEFALIDNQFWKIDILVGEHSLCMLLEILPPRKLYQVKYLLLRRWIQLSGKTQDSQQANQNVSSFRQHIPEVFFDITGRWPT